MSYVGSGFGKVESWGRNAAENDEVYLWRGTFNGANIRTQLDMQAIAEAGGRGSKGLGFDLRGITVTKQSESQADVDLVFTSKEELIYPWGTTPTATEMAERLRASLASRFPQLTISHARWEQITDDAPKHPALDFWLSHYVLWDTPAGVIPMLSEGKPTQAFALFKGLYQGRAEDGISLKEWPKEDPFGPGGNGGDPTGHVKGDNAIWWVLGFGALAWIAYYQSRRQGAAR